jgi:hypothetical protein
MTDNSYLRAELHNDSGRNRTYYRGYNDGRAMVNHGLPLQPLTYRSPRDELIDGDERHDRVMAKLMAAYEEGTLSDSVGLRRSHKPSGRMRLPGVRTAPEGARRKKGGSGGGSAGGDSDSGGGGGGGGGGSSRKGKQVKQRMRMVANDDMPPRATPETYRAGEARTTSAPAATSASLSRPSTSGPRTVAAGGGRTLWQPKGNAMEEKAKKEEELRKKFTAKPKLTAADRALSDLARDAGHLRVCLNKLGPKGRGLTLFVLLTESSTKMTCVAADNTRGLKYQLVLRADPALAAQGEADKLHVLHAVAVAVRFEEVAKEDHKARRQAIKAALGSADGWGGDLDMRIDPEIMVTQMNRPKNMDPAAEIAAMDEKASEVGVVQCRGGGWC